MPAALNVIRYGMARDLVLGLEVVLADGRVLDTLTGLRKDNTGYDIKSPVPRRRRHARHHHGRLPQALSGAALARHRVRRACATRPPRSSLLGALREASGDCVTLVRADSAHRRRAHHAAHPGRASIRWPRHRDWYVLCELSTSRADEPLDALLRGRARRRRIERGWVLDAARRAEPIAQRDAFWRLRESIPEAQRKDGASLKHDISVPVSQVPRFIEVAGGWVAQHIPQGVLVAYGHLGDGNLHFNINQRAGTQAAQLQARRAESQGAPSTTSCGSSAAASAPSTASASSRCSSSSATRSRRTRSHAAHQAGARPERHHESGQGPARQRVTT